MSVHVFGNLAHDGTKNECTHLKTKSRHLSVLASKRHGRKADVWLCVHCVHCAKGKKGQKGVTYVSLRFMICNN